jgi:hypothetical protein
MTPATVYTVYTAFLAVLGRLALISKRGTNILKSTDSYLEEVQKIKRRRNVKRTGYTTE